MSAEPAQSETFIRSRLLAEVVDQLACPACYANLRIDVSVLHCTGCGRNYPIVDGIPVLIADRVAE